jgi:hypothetical protein
MNLPVVHNVLAFKHVVVGVLSRGQARIFAKNSNARPHSQPVESVLILFRHSELRRHAPAASPAHSKSVAQYLGDYRIREFTLPK